MSYIMKNTLIFILIEKKLFYCYLFVNLNSLKCYIKHNFKKNIIFFS